MKPYTTILGILGPFALLTAMASDVAAAGDGANAPFSGDAMRGEQLYESRCTGCHSLDANRVGPKHRGVFGRRVGSVEDFSYSKALANADLIWNRETLERWLTNPQDFLPGQRMNFRVKEARDRADLIAFLRRESLNTEN